jgi:hypothetical protein
MMPGEVAERSKAQDSGPFEADILVCNRAWVRIPPSSQFLAPFPCPFSFGISGGSFLISRIFLSLH